MIDKNDIFESLGSSVALWRGGDGEDTELARVAEFVIARGIDMLSVAPDGVVVLWPWLEKLPVKIISRFYLPEKSAIREEDISNLAQRINTVFKHGAAGVQIFVRLSELKNFVAQMRLIRDDLFFNKDLSIGIDINDIGPFDWAELFDALNTINATSVMFVLGKDAGDNSDFVGRVYSMMENWGDSFNGNLHFMLGANIIRIEQALRLVQNMRPQLASRTKFFVHY